MSNLKVNTINDASGGSAAVLYGVASPPNSMGFRNRILNGGMVIDQRNAGASVTNTTSNLYTLDRWECYGSAASKFTVQQNAGAVTPPAGYTNYLGVTSSSAYSITSGDVFRVTHKIEGYNVSDLAWGSASAQAITLSFWVRSSLTGTFGAALTNSAQNRSYPFTFTISAANTWEQKTITIAGDTTGTWLTTNGIGLWLILSLGAGSTYSATAGSWTSTPYINSATGATSVVGTSGATFYLTGVQLEAGTVATPFERRDYGRELALCQRYCQTIAANFSVGYTVSGTVLQSGGPYVFPTTMRTAPTLTGGAYTANTGNNGTVAIWYSSTNSVNLLNGSGNWTIGAGVFVSSGAVLSAEL